MGNRHDEPDTSVLAGQLAVAAMADHGDPLIALQTLMQAAASLCMVRLSPPAFAIEAFTGAAKIQGDKLRSVLSPDRVRQ